MDKCYFTGNYGIELEMTLEQAESVSGSGEQTNNVLALLSVPEITKQLADIDKDVLISELREYGAWDDDELSDHCRNIERILWLAGCDITENHLDNI